MSKSPACWLSYVITPYELSTEVIAADDSACAAYPTQRIEFLTKQHYVNLQNDVH